MYYTDDMRRAFRSIDPPKGFGIQLQDSDNFLTITLDEKQFANMLHDEKLAAIQYVMRVKTALEDNGAIVMVMRKALEK
jgi:hypothetical protein